MAIRAACPSWSGDNDDGNGDMEGKIRNEAQRRTDPTEIEVGEIRSSCAILSMLCGVDYSPKSHYVPLTSLGRYMYL